MERIHMAIARRHRGLRLQVVDDRARADSDSDSDPDSDPDPGSDGSAHADSSIGHEDDPQAHRQGIERLE
jgi:hypothetical protein